MFGAPTGGQQTTQFGFPQPTQTPAPNFGFPAPTASAPAFAPTAPPVFGAPAPTFGVAPTTGQPPALAPFTFTFAPQQQAGTAPPVFGFPQAQQQKPGPLVYAPPQQQQQGTHFQLDFYPHLQSSPNSKRNKHCWLDPRKCLRILT